MSKPILIGLHNPYSDDPANALAPYPERSAGHRLWRMMNTLEWPMTRAAFRVAHDRRAYMEAFKRYNLRKTFNETGTHPRRQCAADFFANRLIIPGDTVVLLGADVLDAFSHWQTEALQPILIHPQVRAGITWRWLPRPSGRSTKFNDPTLRNLAGMMLANLVPFKPVQEG